MSIQDSINKINQDLAALPPEARGALVVTTNNKGLTISVATKLGDNWKLSAGLEQKMSKTKPDFYVGISKVW